MSRILTGDARKVLAELPAHSVQMMCTSPRCESEKRLTREGGLFQ